MSVKWGLDTMIAIYQDFISSWQSYLLYPSKTSLETLLGLGKILKGQQTEMTSIVSDNGLLPGRLQAIIWINAGILFIGPLGTNFSEILIKIYTFPFKKMHLKMLSWKCRPFFLGLYVLCDHWQL